MKWIHVASTETLTYYEMHEKRGTEAVVDIDILPAFNGTAVHDHWKTYYTFENCTHAECNAHNLRYLKEIYETFEHEWARYMAGFLVELKNQIEALKTDGFTSMEASPMESWRTRLHNIIKEGIKEDDEKSPKVYSKKPVNCNEAKP